MPSYNPVTLPSGPIIPPSLAPIQYTPPPQPVITHQPYVSANPISDFFCAPTHNSLPDRLAHSTANWRK